MVIASAVVSLVDVVALMLVVMLVLVAEVPMMVAPARFHAGPVLMSSGLSGARLLGMRLA